MSGIDERRRLWAEYLEADTRGDHEVALDCMIRLTRQLDSLTVADESAYVFWVVRGNTERELGELARARASYERALELNPRCGRAHAWIGVTWRSEGRIEPALVHLRRALALDEDPLVHIWLGYALREVEEFETARVHFQRSIELDPTHADAYTALADMARIEDPRRALRIIERGIQQDPGCQQALRLRASIVADLRDRGN